MTNNTNAKSKKSGWIALILIIVLIIVIVSTCSDDNKEPIADTQAIEKLTSDSTALLAYLNEDIIAGDIVLPRIPTTISEFNSKTCRLSITIPEERNGNNADQIGIEACTRAAKWLAEKGYTVGYAGIYTSCYVYSPYTGATGKEGLVTSWGNARYDANTDSVEWEWEKK